MLLLAAIEGIKRCFRLGIAHGLSELGGEGIAVLGGTQTQGTEVAVTGLVVVHRIASLIESVSLLSL